MNWPRRGYVSSRVQLIQWASNRDPSESLRRSPSRFLQATIVADNASSCPLCDVTIRVSATTICPLPWSGGLITQPSLILLGNSRSSFAADGSQAREQLAVLRDFDRADLLFVLVASRQLLSLDAGSHIEDIVADAQAMGRTEGWAVAGIDLLRSQKAILPDDPLRCLHIRAAAIVIKSALAHRREDSFPDASVRSSSHGV